MDAWLIGGGALVFALVCGALAGRWKFAKPLIAAATALCLVVMLFGLGIIMTTDFRQLFSYPVQFWGGMGVRHGLLAAGELAGGWILMEGLRQKRRFYIIIAPIFIFGVAAAYYRKSAHDYSALSLSTDARKTTIQSTGYTCTAASLSNLTALFGAKISERQAAEMMRLDYFGGGVWQIGYVLQKLGYNFEETNGCKISEVKFPAILIVKWNDYMDHAVVVTGREGDDYDVLDPLVGKIKYETAWFDTRWKGEGVMDVRRR